MSDTKLERKFAAMLLVEAAKLPEQWCVVVKLAAQTIENLCDRLEVPPPSAGTSERPDPDVVPMDEDGYEELRWGPDTGWSFYREGKLVRDLDQFEDRFVMCAYRGGQESMVPGAEVHRACTSEPQP